MKKGLLKNPFVVAGLIIIAIGFVFVNNILPYMKSDEIPDETAPVDQVAQQVQINIPVESEPLSQDGLQPINNELSLKNNLLKTQGWLRTSSRDPFENTRTDTENEKQLNVIANTNTDTKTDNKKVSIVVKKVINKPRVKAASILKAISIGSAEKVALIGSSVCHEGDTCSLGVVKKIDPDSVIIAGPNGIRILHLK